MFVPYILSLGLVMLEITATDVKEKNVNFYFPHFFSSAIKITHLK
jgi:hypothetical protein